MKGSNCERTFWDAPEATSQDDTEADQRTPQARGPLIGLSVVLGGGLLGVPKGPLAWILSFIRAPFSNILLRSIPGSLLCHFAPFHLVCCVGSDENPCQLPPKSSAEHTLVLDGHEKNPRGRQNSSPGPTGP